MLRLLDRALPICLPTRVVAFIPLAAHEARAPEQPVHALSIAPAPIAKHRTQRQVGFALGRVSGPIPPPQLGEGGPILGPLGFTNEIVVITEIEVAAGGMLFSGLSIRAAEHLCVKGEKFLGTIFDRRWGASQQGPGYSEVATLGIHFDVAFAPPLSRKLPPEDYVEAFAGRRQLGVSIKSGHDCLSPAN